MEDDDNRMDGDGWGEGESAFAWEWRVMVVSAVWAAPGLMLGGLAGVVSGLGGPAELWFAGGAALGAIAGGLMEADHLLC